jgi:predicted permease
MRIPLPQAGYDTPDKRLAFYDGLVARLSSTPGVTGVAVSRSLPTSGNAMSTGAQIVGHEVAPPGHITGTQNVTPGYFRVMGIPLRGGRELTAQDSTLGAAPVALVNEAFVRRYWPTDAGAPEPIGSRLRSAVLAPVPIEIIGIVADVREHELTTAATPQIYVPHTLNTPQLVHLGVRAQADPMSLVGIARAAIRAIDPNLAPSDIRMMDDVLKVSVGQRHLVARLIGLFAGLASLLAAIGIYGVLAYTVAARTEEIGIRRALGAHAGSVLRSVMGQGIGLTFVGVVAGLAGALALSRLMEALLFEVSATDPATFAAVAAAFVAVALLASLVPAWRALRIDPVGALRT